MSLLRTTDLTVIYGGLRALDAVDLEVDEGSLVGLIGPNGAGKTTFIDAITGIAPVAGGTVTLGDRRLDGLGPHERNRLGLSRTFQSLELFEDLSVLDNLRVAAERPQWWSFLADLVMPTRGHGVDDDVQWAFDVVGLGERGEDEPDHLSQGQRKLVGVARALASRPRLVLLDEPAAGLDTTESQALGRRLRSVLEHDISVLLIDHDMGLVLDVCDLVYVLDFGSIIAHGTPDEIRSNPAVVSAYLGSGAVDGDGTP